MWTQVGHGRRRGAGGCPSHGRRKQLVGRAVRSGRWRSYWNVGGGADWSPDDTAIALEGYAQRFEWDEYSGTCRSEWVGGNDFDVYKVASGGGDPVNLTDGAAWVGGTYEDEPADLNPSFSPDGKQIAFASNRNAPRDGGIHSL